MTDIFTSIMTPVSETVSHGKHKEKGVRRFTVVAIHDAIRMLIWSNETNLSRQVYKEMLVYLETYTILQAYIKAVHHHRLFAVLAKQFFLL